MAKWLGENRKGLVAWALGNSGDSKRGKLLRSDGKDKKRTTTKTKGGGGWVPSGRKEGV